MGKHFTTNEIIDLWPSNAKLAADISEKTGEPLKRIAVYRWRTRGSIPGKYDQAIISAAQGRNISLTAIDLMNARSLHVDQGGHASSNIQAPDLKLQSGVEQ